MEIRKLLDTNRFELGIQVSMYGVVGFGFVGQWFVQLSYLSVPITKQEKKKKTNYYLGSVDRV